MNGFQSQESDGGAASQKDHISQALDVVHNPRSSNELRQQASQYLEKLRDDDSAPEHGFSLASHKEHSSITRHYGLSLIDHAIRFKWADYNRQQSSAVRQWVLQLANEVSDSDPSYITNKLAELWVEIAKRSWAVDWMDMDELLHTLWSGRVAQRFLVLNILETLSEDIFTAEDSVAALRGSDLNRACVEIFVPSRVLIEQFSNREASVKVRYGEDGWVARLSDLLQQTTSQTQVGKDEEALCLKGLSTFKSCVTWVIPGALTATHVVERICGCLAVSNMAIQFAALDTLFALYNRSRFSDEEFGGIVGPVFRSETMNLLQQLYQWLVVDPNDIDDSKYVLLKRLSETIFNLGRLLGDRPSSLPEGSDLDAFVRVLMDVMKNESLQVSIPALHLWTKFMSSDVISSSPAVQRIIPDLLETCSQRLIRYEYLPQDSNHPSITFLNEDIETMPEKHAFLGNYARFCNQIVERVVQQQPIDALYHILGQADNVLAHLYDAEPPFNPSTYAKYSIPWLKLDAQFTVIEAALRGCLKWLTTADNDNVKHQHDVMTSNLQVWCDRMLSLTFEDPHIKERVIQLIVGFAVGPLRHDAQFAVRVFDHVLENKCPKFPDFAAYTDAANNLQSFAIHQLQRLAMRFSDHLASIYDVVERKVMAVSQDSASDEQTSARYKSVLFVIVHRATNIDRSVREERLCQSLQPLVESWEEERLARSLSSFDGFQQLLGLDSAQAYLTTRQVDRIKDWSSMPLDEEGKSLQSRIQSAVDNLPLRATKHIFGASVEKLEPRTEAFDIACRLWQRYTPILLPKILQFISLSHACYDPGNWHGVPPDQKPIVRKIFTDRFWQHGISKGTRDDFYASIGTTKATLEGFASSIRASIRLIRETGYRLLLYTSILGDQLYGLTDVAEPLAQALFADACSLSPHQFTILIDTVRPLLECCPERYHAQFLPPMISSLFEQVDRKAGMEWERIERRKAESSGDEDLASEMKDESVLRQLTLAVVMLVASLLEPSKIQAALSNKPNGVTLTRPLHSTRTFILQAPRILKPLITFCTHALGMHDTRSCSAIAKVLRTVVGDFAGEGELEAEVREFISTEVLKACINSLNDRYFADMQKDFAQLIASILTLYVPRTDAPKQVILSLPGMTDDKLEEALRLLSKTRSSSKHQRAAVLELLRGYRSVALRDEGRLPKPDPGKLRSVMQQKYMTADMEGMGINDKDEETDLGGVAEMFK